MKVEHPLTWLNPSDLHDFLANTLTTTENEKTVKKLLQILLEEEINGSVFGGLSISECKKIGLSAEQRHFVRKIQDWIHNTPKTSPVSDAEFDPNQPQLSLEITFNERPFNLDLTKSILLDPRFERLYCLKSLTAVQEKQGLLIGMGIAEVNGQFLRGRSWTEMATILKNAAIPARFRFEQPMPVKEVRKAHAPIVVIDDDSDGEIKPDESDMAASLSRNERRTLYLPIAQNPVPFHKQSALPAKQRSYQIKKVFMSGMSEATTPNEVMNEIRTECSGFNMEWSKIVVTRFGRHRGKAFACIDFGSRQDALACLSVFEGRPCFGTGYLGCALDCTEWNKDPTVTSVHLRGLTPHINRQWLLNVLGDTQPLGIQRPAVEFGFVHFATHDDAMRGMDRIHEADVGIYCKCTRPELQQSRIHSHQRIGIGY